MIFFLTMTVIEREYMLYIRIYNTQIPLNKITLNFLYKKKSQNLITLEGFIQFYHLLSSTPVEFVKYAKNSAMACLISLIVNILLALVQLKSKG